MFQRFQLVAAAALCASLAHAHYDPMDPPHGTVFDGFMCTTTMGVVMQANLSEDCAEWWPGCSRRRECGPNPPPSPPARRCPGHCKKGYLKVRYVPIEGSEPYIHQQQYSSHSGSSKFSTTTWEGKPSASSGEASADGAQIQASGGGKGAGGSESQDGPRQFSSGEAQASSAGGDGGGAEGYGRKASSGGKQGEAAAAAGAPGRGPWASTAAADSASPSAAPSPGRRPASLPSVGDKPMTLEQAMALAERAGVKTGGKTDFSAEAGSAAAEAEAGRQKANYSDPWLDYIQGSSRAELVDKLERDAKLRGDLRRKIEEMADSSGASEPGTREKVEYYRRALAEAEARLRQGGLKALQPLEAFEQEAFAMNGDETDREIRRLLASMDDKAAGLEGDDGLHYPLFSRVHRSLWRQLANGNLVIRKKR